MINCPRCNTQMKEIDYEGVRIDTCPGCEGEWLDADELKKIVARREEVFTSDEIAKVRETIDEPQAVSQDELKEALSCPCCNVPMESFNYACTTGLILDRCGACRGIWMDKDELERVQILGEKWEQRLEADKAKYGAILSKVRAEQEAFEGVSVSRFGVANAFMTGLLRLIG